MADNYSTDSELLSIALLYLDSETGSTENCLCLGKWAHLLPECITRAVRIAIALQSAAEVPDPPAICGWLTSPLNDVALASSEGELADGGASVDVDEDAFESGRGIVGYGIDDPAVRVEGPDYEDIRVTRAKHTLALPHDIDRGHDGVIRLNYPEPDNRVGPAPAMAPNPLIEAIREGIAAPVLRPQMSDVSQL